MHLTVAAFFIYWKEKGYQTTMMDDKITFNIHILDSRVKSAVNV